MKNYDKAIEATDTAMNKSNGSAQKEFTKALDSIAKKTEALEGQFQEFATKGGLSDLIKGFLDAGTAILKFANTDVGDVVVKVAVLTTSIIALRKAMLLLAGTSGITTAITTLSMWSSAITVAADGNIALSEASTGLRGILQGLAGTQIVTKLTTQFATLGATARVAGASMLSATPMILGTVAVLGGMYAVMNIIESNSAYGKQAKEAKKADEAFVTAKETLKKTNTVVKDTTDTLKDLNKQIAIYEQSGKDETVLNKLKKEKDALEETLEVEKEKAKIAQDAVDKASNQQMNKKVEDQYSGQSSAYVGSAISTTPKSSTKSQALKNALAVAVEQQRVAYNAMDATSKAQADKEKTRAFEVATARLEADKKSVEKASKNSKAYKKVQQEIEDYNEALLEMKKYQDLIDKAEGGNKGTTNTKKKESALNSLNKEIKAYNKDIADSNTIIDEIQSSYVTLNTAMSDYNKDGKLSLDNIQSLLALKPQYLKLLSFENGKLVINKNAVKDMVKAQLEQQKSDIKGIAIAKLKKLALAESNNQFFQYLKNYMSEAEAIKVVNERTAKNTEETIKNNAVKGAYDKVADKSKADKIIKEMNKEIKLINSLGNSYGDLSGDTSKNTDATDKNKDAQDKQAKALAKVKAQADDMSEVYSYLTSLADKQIASLEEQQTAEEKALAKRRKADKELKALKDDVTADKKAIKEEERRHNLAVATIEAQTTANELLIEAKQAEIDKQTEANEAVEKAIELAKLQEALATAQSSKKLVMKDGRLTYQADEEAVAKAQADINDYNSTQARQAKINSLTAEKTVLEGIATALATAQELEDKKYDEAMNGTLNAKGDYIGGLEAKLEKDEAKVEARRKDFEDALTKIDKKYTSRINKIEKYKTSISNMANSFETAQQKIIATLFLGKDTENDTWNTRIKNLKKFTKRYNKIQGQLITKDSSSSATEKSTTATAVAEANAKIDSYASGTSSVADNQIAVVGEDPNKEIVIGSNLNKNGTLMNLKQGSGVVNASNTQTLADNLSSLARYSSSGSAISNSSYSSSNANNVQNFSFDKIVLPSVTDSNSFVKELKTNFKNYAIQSGNSR